ncbi:hypothetical protein J3Q64DRAFT_1303546 [Phycomyces blakesleeanus]|uniref:Uncharacterized protein n=1 Tax=Phycomyces blakesleeanus TaxID=4837 RepID=A0ABR3AN83_PHYBL
MPFEGSAVDILQAVLTRNVPPAHTIRIGVPPVMSLMIDKLTRKVVDERYNSAYGLLEDLLECQRRMKCPDPAEVNCSLSFTLFTLITLNTLIFYFHFFK